MFEEFFVFSQLTMFFWCSLLLLLSFRDQFCYGYFVTVDAHAEECFFDKVDMGTKLGKVLYVIIPIDYPRLMLMNVLL